MRLLIQSLILVLSILTVFVIVNTPLFSYISYILALLIAFSLIYVITMKRSKKEGEIFVGSPIEVFAITTAVLLTIFITDGIGSNLFFLLYFLLFGVAFMFSPAAVFVLLAGVIVLFISPALKDGVFSNMIQLGFLVLLSPIAFFFGSEFRKRERLEEKVEERAEKIIEDADQLLHSEAGKANQKEIEKIDEIIEESNELRHEAEKN